MILGILSLQPLTWPTFANALALGGVYALMAVGIGLVFGVLRLVNFAYGQLIMAGGFALAYGALWNCRDVGVDPALLRRRARAVGLMDRLVFRPLRTSSPTVMLVATFAVAFLLQNIALLKFGPLPKSVGSLALLNAPWDIFGVRDQEDRGDRGGHGGGLPRHPPAAAHADAARAAHARRVDGLPRPPGCSASAPTA